MALLSILAVKYALQNLESSSPSFYAYSTNRNRADNVSAIYISIHLALPNTLSDIYACCKQAPHRSMKLLGQIRQAVLPFSYIYLPTYIINPLTKMSTNLNTSSSIVT